MNFELRRFLDAKIRNLRDRSRRLARLDAATVGLRPQDMPFAPTASHFAAASARLAEIDRDVSDAMARLDAVASNEGAAVDQVLRGTALVERQIDRARRAYGLFFELFSQRGTSFAPSLAACDVIAADCFRVVRANAPGLLPTPLLKPLTYLEHGFSPATFRRGVVLTRLLGERNPFPLVRMPFDRIGSPWEMGVLLHEVGHNLQADLKIWHETQFAVQRRVLSVTGNPWIARIWTRWHREIFADLIAVLLGGPASARSMKDFLAYPATRVLTFRPLGVHPVPYIRVFILAEMVRRMGFAEDAAAIGDVWQRVYAPATRSARMPAALLATAQRVIPHVVDEVAFQTRRNLAQRALADVVPFGRDDEARIRAAARRVAEGALPADLPARFAVSAARFAFEQRMGPPRALAKTVLHGLAARAERSATVAAA